MTDNDSAPLLITIEQAAKLLNIGRGLCYQLVQENRLPHLRLGRRLLISRQALEQWVAYEVGDIVDDGVSSDPKAVRETKEG